MLQVYTHTIRKSKEISFFIAFKSQFTANSVPFVFLCIFLPYGNCLHRTNLYRQTHLHRLKYLSRGKWGSPSKKLMAAPRAGQSAGGCGGFYVIPKGRIGVAERGHAVEPKKAKLIHFFHAIWFLDRKKKGKECRQACPSSQTILATWMLKKARG